MLDRPTEFAKVILAFAPLFSRRVWAHACILLAGAILAPGRRTVASALRVMGRAEERHFQNYHRVLNRAVWSGRAASRCLLRLLVETFVPEGPLLLGLDDTLERRWGRKITARGIYRDPVRSSHGHFVKASGLRWLSLMLLAPIPWTGRVWALPFLTVLAPSERYHRERGQQHKKLTESGRQMLLLVRRWLPERPLMVVADSSFAALEFLAGLLRGAPPIHCITRLRLDAALHAPAPPRGAHQPGRPRKAGTRLPTLQQVLDNPATVWRRITVAGWYGGDDREVEVVSATAVWTNKGLPVVPLRWVLVRDPDERFKPQAFLCTQQDATPEQILGWFIRRWQIEVTFEEARAHLGVETQRQWSDRAIARTTPAIFALYSLVTLAAHQLVTQHQQPTRSAAWYSKPKPTFADALAWVRRELWQTQDFGRSLPRTETAEIPRHLLDQLTDALCYAA